MFSIIVLTLNSKESIKPCLDSVFSQSCRDFEVIAVDNASSDGTREIIKGYSEVTLIENKENFGACGGRNQGIEASGGEWILTLDCDTVLEKDFLLKAADVIKNLPSETGILQPKIFNSGKSTIFSCGIHLSWARRFYDIGRGKNGEGFNEPKYIFGACCACAFYKREMLEEIKENTGYFDERFFFLVEDVDLAWRARRKGWKSIFQPKLICGHQGNSSGTDKRTRQYLCCRNRLYSIMKNEGFIRYSLKVLPLLFYDLPRYLLKGFTRENEEFS